MKGILHSSTSCDWKSSNLPICQSSMVDSLKPPPAVAISVVVLAGDFTGRFHAVAQSEAAKVGNVAADGDAPRIAVPVRAVTQFPRASTDYLDASGAVADRSEIHRGVHELARPTLEIGAIVNDQP